MGHFRSFRLMIVGFIILLITAYTYSYKAEAIPAFARKYKTSCATCHEAFPRFTAVGEAFRLNGYKFVDDEVYRKEEPVELGDEAYKKLWPGAIWPSNIPGTLPIALQLTSEYSLDLANKSNGRSEFIFPSGIDLIAAIPLGDDMSAFIEVELERDNDEVETAIEGWVQFEDIIGPENMVNVRIGTVGAHEIGLFSNRNSNRLTANSYLYTDWMPGGDTVDAQPGIELNGFGKHFRYALGITNGSGDGVKDNNSKKDFYMQLAYKIGGIGFDGSGRGNNAMKASSESYRDDSLILSLFGYRGAAPFEDQNAVNLREVDNKFWRAGLGFKWKLKDLALGSGHMFGRNDNPKFLLSEPDKLNSWFIEAEYFVFPWFIPSVRYEAINLEMPDASAEKQDRERLIASIKALLRANVSLVVEGRFYTKDDRYEDRDTENQLVAALAVAF